MKFITSDKQADAIHTHESGMFIEVIEQPPDGYEFNYTDHIDGKGVVWFYNEQDNLCKYVALPHPSGTYDVMERWDWVMDCDNTVIYKAGNFIWCNWKSALTCPKSRYQIEVVTKVMRVQELPVSILGDLYEDLDSIRMAEYWNTEHAKPRLTKDKTAYECFPYDKSYDNTDRPELRTYIIEGDPVYTWKGKLLYIHANPYVAAMDWRKIKL